MIFGGFLKAAVLEFNQIRESALNLIFLFVLPPLFVILFALLGSANYAPGLRYYDAYAPAIFSLFIFFITTQLTVLRVVGERSPYGTLDRDLLAISRSGMYAGKLLVNMIIAFVQCGLIFAVVLVFPLKADAFSLVSMFGIFLFMAFAGLNLGLLISTYARSKGVAVQVVPFIILSLFALSGAIVPAGRMGVAGILSPFTPMALSYHSLACGVVGFDGAGYKACYETLIEILPQLAGLALWGLLFMGLGMGAFVLEDKLRWPQWKTN